MDTLWRRRRRVGNSSEPVANFDESEGAQKRRVDGALASTARVQKREPSRLEEWWAILTAPRNLATGLYALSYTVSLPVLPFMARKQLYGEGVHAAVPEAWRGLAYGLVMSGYYATKMVSAPLIGFMSDRWGRRQALMLTFAGCAATFFLTLVIGQHSIMGLIICRLLMGCFAANGALMHAYVRDTVPTESQASAFAQHSAAWGLAYAAASPILAHFREEATPCLALACLCMVLAAVLVSVAFEETHPRVRGRKRAAAARAVRAIGNAVDAALNVSLHERLAAVTGGGYTSATAAAAAAARKAESDGARLTSSSSDTEAERRRLEEEEAAEKTKKEASEACASRQRERAVTMASMAVAVMPSCVDLKSYDLSPDPEDSPMSDERYRIASEAMSPQGAAFAEQPESFRGTSDYASREDASVLFLDTPVAGGGNGANNESALGGRVGGSSSTGKGKGHSGARARGGGAAGELQGHAAPEEEEADTLSELSSNGSSNKLRCDSYDGTEGPTPDTDVWPSGKGTHGRTPPSAGLHAWGQQCGGLPALAPVGHRIHCEVSPPRVTLPTAEARFSPQAGHSSGEAFPLKSAVHWDVPGTANGSDADEAASDEQQQQQQHTRGQPDGANPLEAAANASASTPLLSSQQHQIAGAAVANEPAAPPAPTAEAAAAAKAGEASVSTAADAKGAAKSGSSGSKKDSWAPMMEVFWAMLGERLIAAAFLLQVVRPAQDMAPLVESRFGKGAGAVAGLSSVRALCRVLVPLTPIIPLLSKLLGGSNSSSASEPKGRVGAADRRVAAFMCVVMAFLAALLPWAPSLPVLHLLAGLKGLCYVIRESTVNAAMATVASSANVGAFFGWQHFMKGMAGVSSNLVAGWLSNYSLEALYFFTSGVDIVYAFTYLYA